MLGVAGLTCYPRRAAGVTLTIAKDFVMVTTVVGNMLG